MFYNADVIEHLYKEFATRISVRFHSYFDLCFENSAHKKTSDHKGKKQ